jgi:hypothetical protein
VKLGVWRDSKDAAVSPRSVATEEQAKAVKASADKSDGKADKKAEPMSYGVSLAPISRRREA